MKKSIVVLLCILMLAIGVTASNTVNAILGTDIKVNLEGKALSLKDANGNQVYPLLFNGTTYLPVRAVAENLGLNVGWDNNTKTVSLSKTETTTTTKQKDVYEIGDWWEVPGLWRVKINSVTTTSERNEYSDYEPQEVVVIDYTYQNLGYNEYGGLVMEPNAVMDQNMKVGKKYRVNIKSEVNPTTVPVGGILENAKVSYGLPSSGNVGIAIQFSKYGKGIDRHEAIFVVPVNR